MHDKSYTSATDREVMQAIGERLVALRKARGLTQKEAAERAGLSRSTLHHAEKGENPTFLTLVRLLRVYGRVAALESFIPALEVSPMARLRERKERSGG